jgi:hypothetical protein
MEVITMTVAAILLGAGAIALVFLGVIFMVIVAWLIMLSV